MRKSQRWHIFADAFPLDHRASQSDMRFQRVGRNRSGVDATQPLMQYRCTFFDRDIEHQHRALIAR